MLTHTHIPAPYTFLTQKEAFEAARQGDLTALQKFVENMQIQVQIIMEEYEHEKEERRQRGLSESFNYGRGITKEYSVNTVKANCYLWYRIYEIAAYNNHINIMNLLHQSSFILLGKMSVNTLGILMGNVIKRGSTDSLVCMFTEATAFNKSISDFLKSYIDSFMVTAIKYDKLESAKYLIKVFNFNLNDNRFLYNTLIQRAWFDCQPGMIAFLAEDCNVDKPYILKCLTERLSTGNPEYRPADLVELVKTIVSKMTSMTIADVVVTENKPSESPSTYTNAEPCVLNNENTTRVDIELTKKVESVQNSNLIVKDRDEIDTNSQVESQLEPILELFPINKSPKVYKYLTSTEAYEAAKQGDLAALRKFVKNIQLQVKIIKEENKHNDERKKRILPDYLRYRNITHEYSFDSVAANSDLWTGLYTVAACRNHIKILKLLHGSSCILFEKIDEHFLGGMLLSVIRSGYTNILIYIFNEAAASNIFMDSFLKSYIKSFMLYAVEHKELASIKFLVKAMHINFDDYRDLYNTLIERAWCKNNLEMIAFLAEDCDVDKLYTIECLTSNAEKLSVGDRYYRYKYAKLNEYVEMIVSKIKSMMIADVVVKENKSPDLLSANTNAQTCVLKNENTPKVAIELSNKVESVKNSNLIAKDKDELDANSQPEPQLQSILESFPNNYELSCNSSDDVKLHIQSIQQQISQIRANLNYQTELTKDLHNHRLLMQQLEQIVNDDEVVLVYFLKLKSRLIDCFIAARLISTGLINRSDYLPTDKIKNLLVGFSSLLTGIAHFVDFSATEMGDITSSALKSVGEGIHLGEFLEELLPASLYELLSTIIVSEDHCLERLAMISSGKDYTLNGLEYTAETIALALAYIYRPQIVCLTNNGAKKFAECSAERVLLLGKEGMVNRSNDWIATVIVYIGLPAIKQTKNFREIEIETKPEYRGRWTENGIHCKSGIMCQRDKYIYYYANKATKHDKYGFRINGSNIAVRIYDMSMLSPDEVSDATKQVSKAYFSNNSDNSFSRDNLIESSDCMDDESCSYTNDSERAATSPVNSQLSTMTVSDSFILSKLLALEEKQRESEFQLRAAHDKIDKLELANKKLRDKNSALKSNVAHIQSTVSHISKQQDTHDKHFKTIKKSGIDLDVIEESSVVLLSTQDFSNANNTGRFFLSEQEQLIIRVRNLELEASIRNEEGKLSK